MKKLKIIVPGDVIDSIQSRVDLYHRNFDDKEKIKMVDTTIKVWYILKDMWNPKYVKCKYHPLFSRNKQLQNIDLKIKKRRFRYTDFIKILNDTNIINYNERHKNSSDGYCKSFKFTHSWSNLRFFEINYKSLNEGSDDDKLKKRARSLKEANKYYPNHKNLIKPVYNIKIEVDELIDFLLSRRGMTLKPTNRVRRRDNGTYYNVVDKNRVLDDETIYDIIFKCLKINNKNITFRISENSGRLFTSITNLSSLCNNFITCNGKKMHEIDVINCQPLLLSHILNDDKFKECCEAGMFYEVLGEEIGYDIEDREDVKIDSYKYIFFNDKFELDNDTIKAFAKLFPSAYANLIELHKEISSRGETIALTLQRIESDIFVNYANGLDFPVLTKHDAIYVSEEYIDIVKNELTDVFKSRGINAKFK